MHNDPISHFQVLGIHEAIFKVVPFNFGTVGVLNLLISKRVVR